MTKEPKIYLFEYVSSYWYMFCKTEFLNVWETVEMKSSSQTWLIKLRKSHWYILIIKQSGRRLPYLLQDDFNMLPYPNQFGNYLDNYQKLRVAKNFLISILVLVNWGRPFLGFMGFKRRSRQSLMQNSQKSSNRNINVQNVCPVFM